MQHGVDLAPAEEVRARDGPRAGVLGEVERDVPEARVERRGGVVRDHALRAVSAVPCGTGRSGRTCMTVSLSSLGRSARESRATDICTAASAGHSNATLKSRSGRNGVWPRGARR